MICPFCNSNQTTCYDTRQMPHYRRRRYKCRNCGERFTTKEWVEEPMPSATIFGIQRMEAFAKMCAACEHERKSPVCIDCLKEKKSGFVPKRTGEE